MKVRNIVRCPLDWGWHKMSFEWGPGSPLPVIEDHSKAKLDVLRRYISDYLDRLNRNKSRDQFKLDLVDGFAGGGEFSDPLGGLVAGSPLVMIEEVEAAQQRLNDVRRKPLSFDCKFHFVDVEPDHTAQLRLAISSRGRSVDGERVVVHTARFSDVVDRIIADIQRRQPIAGRALFLLDQTGYSQVELSLIKKIFVNLPTAEVILTFGAEVLVNFLGNRPEILKTVVPLGLSESEVLDWVHLKGDADGRAAIQRALRDHVRIITGADFDTPFFIRPRESRRALWFVHLSRHPTARDVMINCHWNSSNKFEHYGSGGFDMLGWDALLSGETLPLFNFTELDRDALKQELLGSMPQELNALISDGPVTVDAMHHMLANRTAGRFSDLDEAVLELIKDGEFDILSSDGRQRSRGLRHLRSTDRISRTRSPMFPLWSQICRR